MHSRVYPYGSCIAEGRGRRHSDLDSSKRAFDLKYKISITGTCTMALAQRVTISAVAYLQVVFIVKKVRSGTTIGGQMMRECICIYYRVINLSYLPLLAIYVLVWLSATFTYQAFQSRSLPRESKMKVDDSSTQCEVLR